MASLNVMFESRLTRLGIRIPELLLPRPDVDLRRWAVVACDQYTSDREYWATVEAMVGDAPSTLRLILPEVFLGEPDIGARVEAIRSAMEAYLAGGVLASIGESVVYVRRTTAHSGLREGLVLAFDLERYDYAADSKSLIRSTEGTIVERIPPRLAVRRGAPLELPHIMILVDDPERQVVESWSNRIGELEPLYDIELMQEGGRLEGFRLRDPGHIEELLARLESLFELTIERQHSTTPLFWAMGDGNHSLATAKARWTELKRELASRGEPESRISTHPARWALAEVVNLHSTGLQFEPIHRAVFTERRAELEALLRADPDVAQIRPIDEQQLKALLAGPESQNRAGFFDGHGLVAVTYRSGVGLPPGLIDRLFERFRAVDASATIDFIHGWKETLQLASRGGSCFFVPVLGRERLFSYVQRSGPLPKKAFSMGESREKRYYMEARRIVP